jgi:hypothetical protein
VILEGRRLVGQEKDLEERFHDILDWIGSKIAFSKGKRGVCDIEERGGEYGSKLHCYSCNAKWLTNFHDSC